MNWHTIWIVALVFIIGAYVGTKFPATNLIGRVAG